MDSIPTAVRIQHHLRDGLDSEPRGQRWHAILDQVTDIDKAQLDHVLTQITLALTDPQDVENAAITSLIYRVRLYMSFTYDIVVHIHDEATDRIFLRLECGCVGGEKTRLPWWHGASCAH
jgi:hypothetical protein